MLKAYVALQSAFARLRDDVEGASLVEYALLVALIAILAITALQALSTDIRNAFLSIGNRISTAVSTST